MEPTFFKNAAAFRKWLQKNHEKEKELLVGFYKTTSGRPSMSWSESVDEALCFGWIDGVRKSVDAESYTIRFTPRKPGSIWSLININKVKALTQQGLMQPAGTAAFEKRNESKSGIYSHEKPAARLDIASQKTLKANRKAMAFFKAQAPSYQKVIIHWIMSAKQDVTRVKRLQKLIEESEAGKRL